jgi:enoyl-[acyl-carrier protein] reductase I
MKTSKQLMGNKFGVISGFGNEFSIAAFVAQEIIANGGEVILTYQNDRVITKLKRFADEFLIPERNLLECDVSSEESVRSFIAKLKSFERKIDFFVHSIAFSNRNELKSRYLDISYDNFVNSMNISCYSFTSLVREMELMMNAGASILTISYYGAEKVVPYYNVMAVVKAALEASVKYIAYDLGTKNIRVNAISAGPIKTISASVIKDFDKILDIYKAQSPLKRNVKGNEIANSAIYLLSDLSCGVTGEIHYVDCGYNIMGIKQ